MKKSWNLQAADHRRSAGAGVRLKDFKSCRIHSKLLGRLIHFESSVLHHFFISLLFRLLGLYRKGLNNALAFELRRVDAPLENLPPDMDGFSILFLSDLHIDGAPGMEERLLEMVAGLEVDLLALGGDYRYSMFGPSDPAIGAIRKLISAVNARRGAYAVLGNHDCMEMVESLQGDGITFLINEAEAVPGTDGRLWMVGCDDPHYYQCDDVDAAFEQAPDGACLVFMAHSPKMYKEAADKGAHLYLAGHTHAGQICLPRFGALFYHCPAPRRYCRGEWKYSGMLGYTSAGVGASGAPVRFNCPGEATLITLRAKNRDS